MDMRCCMAGCDSKFSTNGDEKKFHPFPKDFNLCMLWVQNSGRAEYFEDFAFAGAQAFLSRHICSLHFTESDYIDPTDCSLGLLTTAVPIGNLIFQKIEVKEEQIDEDYPDTSSDPLLLSESEATIGIKVEKFDNIENGDDINASFSFSSTDDSCNDLLLPTLPCGEDDIYRETEEEKLLSDEFITKYKNAMRVNNRRMNETKAERQRRLKREALRAKSRRSQESEEQKRMRKMKNALRAAFRRRNETPEQRELRKRKDLLRAQRRRKAETEAEARIRRYNDAVRAAFRRNNETEEQRMARKMKDVIRAAKRRSLETPDQREARLRRERERASKRRMLKRITEEMKQLDTLNDLRESRERALEVKSELVDHDTPPLTVSSIASIANMCNESSNMDHLQQVLQFIENATNKSKRKKHIEKSTDRNERVHYLDVCTHPSYITGDDNSGTVKRENLKNPGTDSTVDEGYQLTDISHTETKQDPNASGKNLEHIFGEADGESEEIINVLNPEVIWG